MTKFLCDQMLVKLGKWLRSAGYDTIIIRDRESDEEILQKALHEERMLITRDQHFLKMKVPEGVIIYLSSNRIEDCIREFNQKQEINWLLCPFSRCLECNTLLKRPDSKALVEQQVPLDVRLTTNDFWFCPHCLKVYWQGSHTFKILLKLQQWQLLKSE